MSTTGPPNDGNLPTFTDDDGRTTILWHGYTIREQFPWTRALDSRPTGDG